MVCLCGARNWSYSSCWDPCNVHLIQRWTVQRFANLSSLVCSLCYLGCFFTDFLPWCVWSKLVHYKANVRIPYDVHWIIRLGGAACSHKLQWSSGRSLNELSQVLGIVKNNSTWILVCVSWQDGIVLVPSSFRFFALSDSSRIFLYIP